MKDLRDEHKVCLSKLPNTSVGLVITGTLTSHRNNRQLYMVFRSLLPIEGS